MEQPYDQDVEPEEERDWNWLDEVALLGLIGAVIILVTITVMAL